MNPYDAAEKYKREWPALNDALQQARESGDRKRIKRCRQELSWLSEECKARHELKELQPLIETTNYREEPDNVSTLEKMIEWYEAEIKAMAMLAEAYFAASEASAALPLNGEQKENSRNANLGSSSHFTYLLNIQLAVLTYFKELKTLRDAAEELIAASEHVYPDGVHSKRDAESWERFQAALDNLKGLKA